MSKVESIKLRSSRGETVWVDFHPKRIFIAISGSSSYGSAHLTDFGEIRELHASIGAWLAEQEAK